MKSLCYWGKRPVSVFFFAISISVRSLVVCVVDFGVSFVRAAFAVGRGVSFAGGNIFSVVVAVGEFGCLSSLFQFCVFFLIWWCCEY